MNRRQLIQILTALDALTMCRPAIAQALSDFDNADNRRDLVREQDVALSLDCWKVLGLKFMEAGAIDESELDNRDVCEFRHSLSEFLTSQGEG